MSITNERVKEAQKQLKKQRKLEKRAKSDAETATSAPVERSQDTASDSDEADSKSHKRKRDAEKPLKLGKAKKRLKLNPPITESSDREGGNGGRNSQLDSPAYPLTPQHKTSSLTRVDKRHRKQHAWVLSSSVGGRLIPVDPVFSPDEKFLLLATRNTVLVYSAANSLLYRKIHVDRYGAIRCFALSPTISSRLYAGTSTGRILHIDWVSGTITHVEEIGSSIAVLAVCQREPDGHDTLYYIDATVGEKDKQGARLYRRAASARKDETKVLLDVSKPLRSLQVLAGGKVIITASEHNVFLGLISDPSTENTQSHSTWHQVQSTESITSICAKLHTPTSSPGKSATRGLGKVPTVDLAVGTVLGAIRLYEDFVTQLTGSNTGKKRLNSAARPTPRMLHWHRGPVSTIQWSTDGNYLISGGVETVLQLWQMKTGKRQNLPHLTSAIDCVTVSPSGTSYAVQLADNSVIVLSTAELQPIAHVSGIQAQVSVLQHAHPSQIRTAASEKDQQTAGLAAPSLVAAAIHPRQNGQLLLAVPASTPKIGSLQSHQAAPFLQTFDLSLAHNISRQALTRNNATHNSMGPESNTIYEPNISFLQISHDGTWLATLEEWQPPSSDLQFIGTSQEERSEQRPLRLEVYLKFWKWDDKEQIWKLDTRIDSPHMLANRVTPARVQCLRAHPLLSEFITAGEDGTVKIWKATTRYRDSVVVRGQGGTAMTVWSCRATVGLDGPVIDIEDELATDGCSIISRLAYSDDGSIIAACSEDMNGPTNGVVRLIDSSTGAIKQSRPDLFVSGLKDVAFLDRYLIILSDSLTVFDVVNDELSYQHDFRTDGAQLSVNATSGTFALAVPSHKSKACRIVVFDPKKSAPLYDSPDLDPVTALLSLPSSAGYVFLNGYAEARTLSLNASASVPVITDTAIQVQASLDTVGSLPSPQSLAGPDTNGNAEDVEMDEAQDELEDDGTEDEDYDVDDGQVIRPQQLAALFEDRPSFAMPPVRDMFDSIVEIYGRKSRANTRNKRDTD